VDPSDTEKTAFICREGQFKFRTMPFGLCNVGATFQRLMDLVMTGLAFEVCLCLDDVIIFSSTLEEHFERLRMVLTSLSETGLKLKPSKCRLLQKEVAFLGHVVSEERIGTDPEKIRAITEWPVPENLRAVRAFLGLCSYYRKYVRDFARISAPLHALTRKGATFGWSEECQEAFDLLKNTLISPPILAMPDEEGIFLLEADAPTVPLVLFYLRSRRESNASSRTPAGSCRRQNSIIASLARSCLPSSTSSSTFNITCSAECLPYERTTLRFSGSGKFQNLWDCRRVGSGSLKNLNLTLFIALEYSTRMRTHCPEGPAAPLRAAARCPSDQGSRRRLIPPLGMLRVPTLTHKRCLRTGRWSKSRRDSGMTRTLDRSWRSCRCLSISRLRTTVHSTARHRHHCGISGRD